MLHGAIGSSGQLQQLAAKLSVQYDIHLFDFPGHGGKELPDVPFSIKLFAEAALDYIQQHQLQQVSIFGYSMGGYVALYLARHHPQVVDKVFTLGTKFHWDEATAAKEIKMLDPHTIATKVPAFATTLARIHAPNDWKEILQRTANMLVAMGQNNPLHPEDYTHIKTPSLIMLGDRDKMVTLEETVTVSKQLPDARMAVLPGTPHPVEQVNPALVAYLMEVQ